MSCICDSAFSKVSFQYSAGSAFLGDPGQLLGRKVSSGKSTSCSALLLSQCVPESCLFPIGEVIFVHSSNSKEDRDREKGEHSTKGELHRKAFEASWHRVIAGSSKGEGGKRRVGRNAGKLV